MSPNKLKQDIIVHRIFIQFNSLIHRQRKTSHFLWLSSIPMLRVISMLKKVLNLSRRKLAKWQKIIGIFLSISISSPSHRLIWCLNKIILKNPTQNSIQYLTCIELSLQAHIIEAHSDADASSILPTTKCHLKISFHTPFDLYSSHPSFSPLLLLITMHLSSPQTLPSYITLNTLVTADVFRTLKGTNLSCNFLCLLLWQTKYTYGW